MVVKVVSKVGQALARWLDSLSLADGSMLLRMRRASIALLALVGAVGLGLIVFISQLGWPGVVSGPLPGPPTQAGTVHNAIALTEAAGGTGVVGPAAVSAGKPARDLSRRGVDGSRAEGRSQQLGEGKKLTAAPGAGPGQGVGQPVAQPPSPAATPGSGPAASPPASVPTAAVVDSPPQSGSADPQKSAVNSKTTEASTAKAVSDSSKSAATAATKSQGQKSAVDKGSSSSKASEAASAKAKRDESAAKAGAPPAAVAPEKSAPVSASPAAAKEAADAANSR